MTRLESVSLDDLHDALDDATGKKATRRLMVAILYKRGPSVPMIADWFDMREGTVYRWFDRLEAEPVEEAIRDRPKPGRPPKLTDDQRETFEQALREPPTERGYDASAWSPAIARDFLDEEFDVAYTLRHVRRLLNETARL